MNTTKISKSNPTIKRVITACFPQWKGRKIRVEARTSHTEYLEGGGTYYELVNYVFADRMALPLPRCSVSMPKREFAIVAGSVIVIKGTFCGKDAGITILVAPIDAMILDVANTAIAEGRAVTATAALGETGLHADEIAIWVAAGIATVARDAAALAA